MPKTKIIIYQDEDGSVPLIKWLREQSPKVQDKCTAMIELLAANGNELKRPHADYVDGGIYELRPTVRRVHYRILYCFIGKNIVLLTHGFVKTGKIPRAQIRKALEYKDRYVKDSRLHRYEMKD